MLNLQSKDTFYVFDEWGMLTVKSDALSWRDSIGMTVCAWIAYGRPEELRLAVKKCWYLPDAKWILYRHPKYKEEASRDHYSYALIMEKLFCGNALIYGLPRLRGMNLWMRSITGNKLAEWMYYTLYIPGAILGNVWLKFCRLVGRINPERDNDWWIFKDEQYGSLEAMYCFNRSYKTATWNLAIENGVNLQRNRTRWQKLWAWIIFKTIPAYPLHNKGWQLYVMRKVPKRDTLRKILLKRVGKSNILLRLLYGDDTVTQEEVDNYPHMTGFRPGVYLDESCRRHIRELTPQEAEFNAYERDLIVKLWIDFQQKDCKMNNEYYDYDPE